MSAPRPRVTVVIPTHDRLAMLPQAIDSALGQEAVDVEVVVVDDASSDGTAEWLRAHADERVRTIRLDPGRERCAARNAGLNRVTTPFVLFLDDDDVLAARALQRLARALERHPRAPVAAGTYATFGEYSVDDVPRRPTIGRLPIQHRMSKEILFGWYLLPGAALWRAEYLRSIGGWDETMNFAEDLELSLRIHPSPMALVPHVVLRYRHHARPVDPEVRAREEAINAEVRRAFVECLPASERRRAQRVVDARPTFAEGLDAYADGRYRVAVRALVRGIRAAPALLASPILGPMVVSMIVKALVAQAAPERLQRRVRESRRATRARRYGSEPT